MFTPTYSGKDYCFEDFIQNTQKISYPNVKHVILDNSVGDEYFRKLKNRLMKTSIDVYKIERGGTSREAIARAQNFARKMALENGYDYLFSLESDIFVPHDVIQRMLMHAKPVVTGMYLIGTPDKKIRVPCATVLDFKPALGMYGTRLIGIKDKTVDEEELKDFMSPGLKQVAAGGMGVCMIRRDALEQIPFMYEPKMAGHSDIFWFNECHRKKIPVFVDTSIFCDHQYSDWKKVTDR